MYMFRLTDRSIGGLEFRGKKNLSFARSREDLYQDVFCFGFFVLLLFMENIRMKFSFVLALALRYGFPSFEGSCLL